MKNLSAILKQIGLLLLLSTTAMYAQSITWQQLNGPFGGTALSFASNGNGDLFAGADQDQQGIFRSTDAGLAWHPKSTGLYLENRAFNWLLVDDSGHVIAGTGSHIGNKVYKSRDDGESWTQISILGGTSAAVNDSGHIYVGNTGYAQYSVSRDGGYSWTDYAHPSPFINCITLNDSGHLFIGGNYTGYRSTDNGANWTTLPLPDGINSIAVAPNGHVYAGCSREWAANSGVYRSTDNGGSWTAVKEGFRVAASRNIVVNDSGDIIVGTWGWGIWKSTDNGESWGQHNSGLGHLFVKSVHISDDGNVFAGVHGGGIYRSTDTGESWSQVGMAVARVVRVAVNPSNGTVFSAVNGVSRSTDGGMTWHPANTGLTNYDVRTFAFKTEGTIFLGGGGGGYNPPPSIFRSIDNGDNWVPADTGIPNQTVGAMSVDAEGNVYAGTSSGVYQSTNNGSSWLKIGSVTEVRGIAFNASGDLFVASWGGGIWRKPWNDTAWTNITGSLYPYVGCVFVGANDYLYAEKQRSTDDGETWAPMTLAGSNVSSYAENTLGHLFCGTYNYGDGVSRSTNHGETWEQVNAGLPVMDVRSVAVDAADFLYAGTNGASVSKTTTSTATAVEDFHAAPTSYQLGQNYPNPCNPVTTISYALPSPQFVTLKVYDNLGREVATLVSDRKQAGYHQVSFDGKDLSTGVYYYRILAGALVETKKLIVVR